MRPLLEVVVTHPGDVAGAVEGGAARLLVRAGPDDGAGLPSSALVRSVRAQAPEAFPVRALLKANDGWSTTGSELSRLQGAAYELAAAGADGFALGFCGPTLEVDVAATASLVEHLQGLPWTFHRAIDQTLDHDRSWRVVRALPGLDSVQSAGSARGLSAGLDDLCRRAAGDPETAALVLAGGGLEAEHVPWLVRVGVRAFHVAERARPAASWRAYVDSGHVRSWRRLLDDAVVAAV